VVKAFITIALAKPLMVIGLRLGASFVAVPADGKLNLWSGVLGLVVLGISAFAPGVLYKLFGVMEGAAGQRMGGASHGIDAAGRSAVDAGDSARSVFSANAPSTPVAASSGAVAGGGGAGAAAGGGGAAAAAAGPIGLVVGAGMMAASTTASVGSMVASQVGTGGGALGDAEHAQPGSFPRSYGSVGLPPQAQAPSASPSMPTPPPPPAPMAQP